jgi:hypothetical protein
MTIETGDSLWLVRDGSMIHSAHSTSAAALAERNSRESGVKRTLWVEVTRFLG